jgi:transposase
MILKAVEVRLKPKARAVLEARLRASTTEQRDVLRARIVLLSAEGRSTRSIAREVGTMPRTVSHWRGRFAREGLAGLTDKQRPGPAPKYTAETGRRILAVLERPPPAGFARWTGPLIASDLGDVSEQHIWRFLRAQQIDLDGRKSWCESDDPAFAAKAADVVGLYMAPPENAIVICVDEKPSIQALERAQGYLKLPNGRTLTGHSHDYKRNGTSTLFAAFEVATGKVTVAHKNRRRRVEFLEFRWQISKGGRPIPHLWRGAAGQACTPKMMCTMRLTSLKRFALRSKVTSTYLWSFLATSKARRVGVNSMSRRR